MDGELAAGLLVLMGLLGGLAEILPAATIDPSELGPYQVIRARSAIIRHGDRHMPAPAVLYDGTGLTDDNPLLAAHGPDPDTIWQYAITPSEYPVAVEFELDGDYLVNEMWVWQLQGDLQDQGLRKFDILMRDASRHEVGRVEGALEHFNRVGVQPVQRFNAFGECVFLPIPELARYVEVRIHENRGNEQWLGLAEVLFAGRKKLVPEPSSSAMSIVAGLSLWSWRRRSARVSNRVEWTS